MKVDLFAGQQYQADGTADEERGERSNDELRPAKPAKQQSENEREFDVAVSHATSAAAAVRIRVLFTVIFFMFSSPLCLGLFPYTKAIGYVAGKVKDRQKLLDK